MNTPNDISIGSPVFAVLIDSRDQQTHSRLTDLPRYTPSVTKGLTKISQNSCSTIGGDRCLLLYDVRLEQFTGGDPFLHIPDAVHRVVGNGTFHTITRRRTLLTVHYVAHCIYYCDLEVVLTVYLSRPRSSSSLRITDWSFRYASHRLWNQLPASL